MTRLVHLCLAFACLASASLVSGCNGADCTTLCTEARARGCLFTEISTGSCEGDCDLADQLSARAGCDSLWSAYLDCEASQADLCEPGCEARERDATDCVAAYCLANTGDDLCRRAAGL